MSNSTERKVAVIGLGYVGLPVAVAFGGIGPTIGFDINCSRIEELKNGHDSTGEVDKDELLSASVQFTSEPRELASANFYIVAVPTPINESNQPDLSILESASKIIAEVLKKGDIVVYESTVFPGATEEECIPILEQYSGLIWKEDFSVGYSPERINPGDKEHTFTKIKKIVSGDTQQSLEVIANTYGSVVTGGIFEAQSIKVAEAAKVIENTQRDLNIALMNELSLIFNLMNIDTKSVLEAAETKWNFLPFKPGLVGGHCIGVDPYYLTHKAEKIGYIPQVILAGRRINDSMGNFIASQTIKFMIRNNQDIVGSTVTILGLTFKENCSDLRNSKVIDIINELKEYGVKVQVHDAYANPSVALKEYNVKLVDYDDLNPAAALIVAVAHQEYVKLDYASFTRLVSDRAVIIDIKGVTRKWEYRDNFKIWSL